jgi:membrane protease subunit HflK
MERVLGGTDKIILDSPGAGGGVVPYISLDELTKRGPKSGQEPQPQRSQSGANR